MSGRDRPGFVTTNSRRQNNAELRGTYIPFRPFLQVGIGESDCTDSNDTSVKVEEVRYQTITMLPEYRDKSLDELRYEDYQANRHRIRQVLLNLVLRKEMIVSILFWDTFNLSPVISIVEILKSSSINFEVQKFDYNFFL